MNASHDVLPRPTRDRAEPVRSRAAPAPELASLDRHLGDLVVEGEVARTSRAAVYRVRLDRHGDRPLALKVALHPSDRDDLARFRHEARLLSEVRHPNVVAVYEVGVLEGDLPFVLMELVEPYRPPERPSAEELYDLAIQAAAGLAHIHHHRVVHLDVKPGNLGVAEDSATGERRLKILDFGLAQTLVEPVDRAIRGTLAYTAPEVLLQDRYDHRADLYSLGLTLWEIATGTLPSAGGDREAILHHLAGETPDLRRLRPDLPEPLAEIVTRLLRRDPGDRHASAGRLLEELARAAGREVDPGELALGTGGVLASRLVGRRPAVERLSTELAAARRGESRVLVVEGPEGVGKSRLLREFRLLAAIEGGRTVLGRASAGGGRPLQPFLETLDQLGLEVAASGDEPPSGHGRGRFRLYREIGRKLTEAARRPGRGPLVLILEDLHLAGPESRELLVFLASDLESAELLIVASRRTEAGPTPAPPAPEGAQPEVLALPPLPREATVELVDASLGVEQPGSLPPGLYDWLHEASEGIPGTLQQLLCQLIDEGDLVFRRGEWKPRRSALARLADRQPTDELDWRRLGGLDEQDRRLLDGAAVIGEPFRASVLAELLERPVEDVWVRLAALAEQGFLDRLSEPGGTVYALAGSRLREGLYALLDPTRRAEIHLRLGESLARSVDEGARDLTSGAAEHLWRAGRRSQSLPYLLAAARDAVAIHAHSEAAVLYGRATEAAEQGPDEAAAREARTGRARALALAGHPGRALREYQRLLDEPPAGTTDDEPSLVARWNLEKGRLHGRTGEHAAALAAFEAGLDAGSGDPQLRIELLHGKAVSLRDLGRTGEAFDTARGALRDARRAGLGRQRALLVNTLAMMAFARGDWRRAGRLSRWGLRGAEGTGDAYLAVLLRNTLAMVRWKTGDFDRASDLYAENLAAADELNDPWVQLTALNNLGILRCGRGEWSEARSLLGRSLEMNRRLGAREGEILTRINLGEVEEILGGWQRARRHANRALALLESSEGGADRVHRVAAQLLLASLARKSGEMEEAAALLEAAEAGAGATGDRDLGVQVLVQRGLLEMDRGRLDRAGGDLDAAMGTAAESGTGELLGRILLARTELALARGDREAAERDARAAQEQAEGLRDRLARGRLLAIRAQLAALAEGEDTVRAEHLFTEAVAALEEVEAPYDVARTLYAWGLRTRSMEPALDRLQRALTTFEELGAEPDADRARGALARVREHRHLEGGEGAGHGGSTIQEVMRILNSSLDQRDVLNHTMDLALERLGAERGMIVLVDSLTRELDVAVARNLGRRDEAEGRKLSESVVRRVVDKNEPVLAVDALTDSRFSGAESIVASHILSILCVPLSIRDRLAGAIYVDHCRSRHLFGKTDLEFLEAFADVSAVAIENSRLFGELEDVRRRLEAENRSLRREMLAAHHLGSLIGKSRHIEELKATLERVAESSSTVLIRGESGTGKGLVARIIHNVSPRREGPFVHFNCAALPETLVESELFGHERGAFTGATERKPGRFELAHEGTIFLDEVGKVSPAVQAKLLRVVEDKAFERVGGTRTQRSDVRIIAATNLDLEEAITRAEFREDLYYRLNIIPIVLPPLRERREDVPYLVRHFLERIGRDLGQAPRELDPAALEVFERHPWPGNVRELESAIHRALVLSPRRVLGPEDFAWIAAAGGEGGTGNGAAAAMYGAPASLEEGAYQEALDAFDRRLIETALVQSGGKIRETARLLGIARNTLKAKMKKYGLEA